MSTTTTTLRPPYDPELVFDAAAFGAPIIDDESLAAFRAQPAATIEQYQPLLDAHDIVYEEISVPVPGGEILLSILRPRAAVGAIPLMYDIHGGGMIAGNRLMSFMPEVFEWAATHQLAVISPEYTLAPDQPAPRAAIESYAGLKWVVEHHDQLRIDPQRIILAGVSGGGGLAASVGLLVRDQGGPELLAQMLLCPQLEDRHQTVSSHQFSIANGAVDPWPRETNQYAWDALLGAGHEGREVSIYESPARAEDLSGLPQTFIDAGACEVFRDAAVAYASKLWEGGVSAELHIWPGGFHGFDVMSPTAPVSHAARAARANWLERILGAVRN